MSTYGVDLFPPEDFGPRVRRGPPAWVLRACSRRSPSATRAPEEPGRFMADGLLDLVARVGRLYPATRWPPRRYGVPYQPW